MQPFDIAWAVLKEEGEEEVEEEFSAEDAARMFQNVFNPPPPPTHRYDEFGNRHWAVNEEFDNTIGGMENVTARRMAEKKAAREAEDAERAANRAAMTEEERAKIEERRLQFIQEMEERGRKEAEEKEAEYAEREARAAEEQAKNIADPLRYKRKAAERKAAEEERAAAAEEKRQLRQGMTAAERIEDMRREADKRDAAKIKELEGQTLRPNDKAGQELRRIAAHRLTESMKSNKGHLGDAGNQTAATNPNYPNTVAWLNWERANAKQQ